MTKEQRADLRVFICGCAAIIMILPWIEWHNVRPAALMCAGLAAGAFVGFALAAVMVKINADR